MKTTKCTICNYEISENEKKVSSPDGKTVICSKCIETAFLLINPTITNYKNNETLNKILDIVKNENNNFLKNNENIYEETSTIEKNLTEFLPNKIHDKLNDYIIGQEETKKVISVAIFQHLTRIKMLKEIEKEEIDEDLILKKSNILLIGDSGSGKTLFAETIAKILNIPLVIADASSLTSKGYIGGDVDDMLQTLLAKSDNDVELAEQGIIFIDEIDKISSNVSSNGKQKDVTGSGVQENLLKMMEGTTVQIKNPRFHPMQGGSQTIELNTKNILFIFGGAFSGLDDIIKEYNNEKYKMGFKTTLEKDVEKQHGIVDYILDYGFSPEFLGRIPIISQLKKLEKEELLKIITEPKNSILKQYITFFKSSNIEIEFSENALNKVVEEIQNNKIGARALKKIFENIFLNITYDIQNFVNSKVIITEEYIKTEDLKDLKIIKFIDDKKIEANEI